MDVVNFEVFCKRRKETCERDSAQHDCADVMGKQGRVAAVVSLEDYRSYLKNRRNTTGRPHPP